MADQQSNFAGTFATELVKVLENTMGERPGVEIAAPTSGLDPDALAWRQDFSGSKLKAAWIAAAPSSAREIGAKLLNAAGVAEYGDQEATATYLQALAQALSGFTHSIGARDGLEVAACEGRESRCPSDLSVIPIRLMFPSGSGVALYAHFDEDETPAETAPQPAAGPEPEHLKNLDLLLDVELPVTVSFGRAQLPLKEVIKLTTGSTIELNRTVSDPVELIVNNCVVAKGEVVVVDGNFAVRIERVVSRQDRLRSIG
jgi:flagellar motor switch protein FliN/FliY